MIFKSKILLSCVIIILLNTQVMSTQEKAAYQLYTSGGEKVEYNDLLNSALQANVIFFGEFHDNPICHWLQNEILRDLYEEYGDRLVFGGEFFEADDQLKIDEYLSGLISQNNFEREARLWNNYKTDYKAMLEYAKENNIPFIATNVPRRYANLVFREGPEALHELPQASLSYIAELPYEVDFELRTYESMMEMARGRGNNNFVYAQAIKDVTMAHFINSNLNENQVFYHINGSFHSNYKEGIIWYLKKMRPELKILNIATVLEEDATLWNKDNRDLGDLILAIPERMSRSY